MHPDLLRCLAVLAVVRLLTLAAVPAPGPARPTRTGHVCMHKGQATLCVQSAQYRTRSSEIALLRCCVFADSRLRKNAMVCLRWHGTGLNSTDYHVLSLFDSLKIQTSDFHLSPHSSISI